ncbi:N5-glutamine methyltransferase family protein [Desulfurella multipotens]|uniref:N5-glutamine methyltransferase family protein n=1 Tax=Desulfurella multipotens TaxID=79269 RepID=UPI000CB6674D|nr:HemK/PrmC family methyltransferase [Desulfurella multipotens]PMP68267.1 MAG: protein-(glutamine-N5) methyltransferase, release factor-specific [Desulfurella multipotens]
MKLKTAISKINALLKKHGIESSILESTIIASYILKKDDCFILSNPDFQISESIFEKMFTMAANRVAGVPLAYLTHKKEFMGLNFYVNENVLIPRPETELLVQEAIGFIQKYNFKNIVDLCTGSGAIAISIEHFTCVNVAACDISYKALKVASINKKLHQSNVCLINSNLLFAFKGPIDMIVSNPPYILPSEFDSLSNEVKKEPKIALLCDEDYLLIKTIIEQSSRLAKFLLMEISPNMKIFLEQFDKLFCIKKDYAGLDRVAIFRF